jgi:hypothetical protein
MLPPPSIRLAASLLLLLGANGSAESKPDIRRKPQPRSLYDVTVTVRGAPGLFDRTEGWTDYRVMNEPCVPLTPITGVTSAPEWRESIALEAVGGNVYQGQVVTDLLADENYYGLGVCHWDVVAATVVFAVRGIKFTMPLFKAELKDGRVVTRYYSNRSYATTNLDRVDLGEIDRAQYQNEADETFSISVQVRSIRS